MKNRYKALIIVLSFVFLLAVIGIIIGFGFSLVSITQHGYSYNKVFGTITNNNIFNVGNYFVGVDHQILKYPSNLIKYQLIVNSSNTKDKSTIDVEVLFLGQFIPSQLFQVNLEYGMEYEGVLKEAVKMNVNLVLEEYNLRHILARRSEVQGEISSKVRSNLQKAYPWIKCRLVSLGFISLTNTHTNATKPVLRQNPALYEMELRSLKESYQLQKEINFLKLGVDLLKEYELFHGKLFNDVMAKINGGLGAGYTNKTTAAMYLMSDPVVKGMRLDKVEIKI